VENRYNLKEREIKYVPGQEVFKRNFGLSEFNRNINAKFCRKYVKCRIVRPVGKSPYELETMQGSRLESSTLAQSEHKTQGSQGVGGGLRWRRGTQDFHQSF